MKEETLSDKIQEDCIGHNRLDAITVKDIKEFIKNLKESISVGIFQVNDTHKIKFIFDSIDELAGDKLK